MMVVWISKRWLTRAFLAQRQALAEAVHSGAGQYLPEEPQSIQHRRPAQITGKAKNRSISGPSWMSTIDRPNPQLQPADMGPWVAWPGTGSVIIQQQ